MQRAHIGDILRIVGTGFGDTQGINYVKIDGIEAAILTWTSTLIRCVIPECTINVNGYVTITIGNIYVEYDFPGLLWVLLGGQIRFVDPDNWTATRLDLDNGGEGSDQEIWIQQGTMVPLPASSPVYSTPDRVDGETLVVSRLPNKEITLRLLLTAVDKAHLDELFSSLVKELYRGTNCLRYLSEGSTIPIYYTTFRVVEGPDTTDYFTHKERGTEGAYAWDVQVRVPCLPYAEMEEEEVTVCANLLPNGSFEKRTVHNFDDYDEYTTGSATVEANTAQYLLPGGTSCKLTTTAAGEIAQVTDSDFIQVDATKTQTFQLFAYKHEGTIKLSATLYCYDEDGVATSPASLALATDVSPSAATKWRDVVVLSGEPIVYPEGSVEATAFPAGTTKVKFEVRQVGPAAETAAVSIDALVFSESEYISDHLCEASMGIVIPSGVFKGDIPSPLDVYISGAFGSGVWTARNMGILQSLLGLDYVDASRAYAVGGSGKIMFNDGDDWTAQSSGTTATLRSVIYVDASHIWVVGDGGVIRKYSGAAWVGQTYPANANILPDGGFEWWTAYNNLGAWDEWGSVHALSWSVTRDSAHKRSGSWCALLRVTADDMFQRTTGWYYAYVRVKGTTFFAVDTNTDYSVTFALRKMVGAEVNPVVGTSIYFYTSGGVEISSLVLDTFVPSSSTAWGTHTGIFHASDIPSNATKAKLYVRVGVAPDRSTGCYLDTFEVRALYPDLHGVTALDANHVIAVGGWGKALQQHNGGAWAVKATGVPTAYTLRGVHAIAGHAWAVGDNGIILHSTDDGATWAPQACPVTDDLYAVYALDASNVWVVGEDGTILYYNGTAWAEQASPTGYTLRSVGGYLDGATPYVWAAGDEGRIIEYTASIGVWTEQGSGTSKTLYGIGAIDTTIVLAVGAEGTYVTGKSTATALYLTNLILGQGKGHYAGYNPVLDAVTTGGGELVELYTRRKQKYRAMKGSVGDTEEWLFNVAQHKGLYLLSIGGAINNAVNYDQIVLTLELQDTAGNALTPTTVATVPPSLDLSTASGAVCVGEYFREVAMLGRYPSRFKEITIPSSFVGKKANLLNINQSILLTAPGGMAAADRLYIDCLSLIPVDRAFTEVNNWRSGGISGAQQAYMILSSNDKLVLSSLYGTLESAMVHNPSYWNGAPQFEADPLGINMTLVASMITGSTTTTDYQFVPRFNVKFKYRPRVLLAGV